AQDRRPLRHPGRSHLGGRSEERRRRRPRPHGHRRNLRQEHLWPGRDARAPPQAGVPGADEHRGPRRGAGPVRGRRRGAGDEGVGHRARGLALHPLVPAPDRLHGREARLVHHPQRGRGRRGRVQRQGADPGRAGRVVVPLGRAAGDLRGPRLHGVGPHLAGLHRGHAGGVLPLHPHRLRVVDGRGAGREDPPAALDRGAGEADPPRAGPVRRAGGAGDGHLRAGAGVLPGGPGVLLPPAGPGDHGAHPVRRQAAARAGAGGPLLRLHPGPRAGLHDRGGARAVQAGRAAAHPAQRGGAGAVRDGAHLRERQPGGGPPAAGDDHAAQGGAEVRAGLPPPREAVRGGQRERQAPQLGGRHRPGEPAGAGGHAAPEHAVPLLLHRRAARGGAAPGPAALGRGVRRQRPPAGGQRGAAGHHLGLPGHSAVGRVRPDRGERHGHFQQAGRADGAGEPGAPAHPAARGRPQPHLALRLHGEQVRVPRAGRLAVRLVAGHGAQHRDGRVGGRALHRAGSGGGERDLFRGRPAAAHRHRDPPREAHHLQRRRLQRRVAGRGGPPWPPEPAHHAGRAGDDGERKEHGALREVRRPLRPRAGVAPRDRPGDLLQDDQHRGRDHGRRGGHDGAAGGVPLHERPAGRRRARGRDQDGRPGPALHPGAPQRPDRRAARVAGHPARAERRAGRRGRALQGVPHARQHRPRDAGRALRRGPPGEGGAGRHVAAAHLSGHAVREV
ncbi:MAG: Glutamine synthetase type III, GlnN, partial [uncultured Gemmatimonadetes bacterium]